VTPYIVLNFLQQNHLRALISQIILGMKFYMFRTVPLSIIRSFSLYTRQLASRIRMKRSSILILLASCQQTCMTYTIAVCTVKSSWWWTEKLS